MIDYASFINVLIGAIVGMPFEEMENCTCKLVTAIECNTTLNFMAKQQMYFDFKFRLVDIIRLVQSNRGRFNAFQVLVATSASAGDSDSVAKFVPYFPNWIPALNLEDYKVADFYDRLFKLFTKKEYYFSNVDRCNSNACCSESREISKFLKLRSNLQLFSV